METVNDRIECIVNALFGGKKATFANAIGLDRFVIGNYLGPKKRSKPPVDVLAKIVTELNVDAYWLLTGEGEMMKDEASEQSIVVGDINHVKGPVSVSQTSSKAEPADTAALRARLEAAESLVEALRAQLTEKDQTAAVLRQLVAEKQKLINLLEAR